MSSEFDIIRRYFMRPTTSAVLGIGDDAALIASTENTELAISTDTLVSEKHFFANADPRKLGYKSLAVNLSDMAAMGARPRWVMLALTLPKGLIQGNKEWLSAFSSGFLELAHDYQIELVGGDTTCGPLNVCVQIIGEVTKGMALRRSGAKVGDDIWVSGYLGTAALALAHKQQYFFLEPSEIAQCLPALHTPKVRLELGQRLIGLAHSAIDISDGLMADLGHILASSNVAAIIKMDTVPCTTIMKKYLHQSLAINCLLAGGDDYELCFTAPMIKREKLESLSNELFVPLTRIGSITRGVGLTVQDTQGSAIELEEPGYDHFRSGYS